MKHVKLFEQHINESIQGGSYYFSKNMVNVAGIPAKGEIKYAVISNNSIDFEGATMHLKGGTNSQLGAFETTILSIHDTEDEAKNAYNAAVKRGTGAEPYHVSFAYGTLEVKGTNLPFREIDGTRAKLSR
jgi:hypothetical protein